LKFTISETVPAIRDGVDDLTKGCVIECLANAAGVDGTHCIVRATLLVTLDSMLHGQTAIKHDVNERGIWQDIGNSSKGREFSQRVTSEGGARKNEFTIDYQKHNSLEHAIRNNLSNAYLRRLRVT
jgi:hypothetical protein